jgi:hypothetical protein
MDPDAHLELDFERYRELPDGLHHLESASNRTGRTVLLGERVTEIDLDAVAPILGHETLVPKHHGFATTLEGTHRNPQVFRIQPLGKWGGTHKVAEQHA